MRREAMSQNHLNPILYLYEYSQVPEEIFYRKNDEALRPWSGADDRDKRQEKEKPELLCVGIGTYRTVQDGEIYLCILIEPECRTVYAYSLGVYRSPQLVDRALEILFSKKLTESHFLDSQESLTHSDEPKPLILLSSQNPIYRKKQYSEILAKYPVEAKMTARGTRGGVMAVSTFFSQLMRKKGRTIFRNWQEAVDWLENYIHNYNQERTEG